MAIQLPGVTHVANIKGAKGDKGNTGVLAYVTAETVPADQPASAAMVGPEDNRGAHIQVPRGLPGLNAVPTDEAVSVMLGAEDTLSNASMKAALSTTFLPLSGMRVPLDLWGDYSGPPTYDSFISEIDGALLGAATKIDAGLSSGSSPKTIYAYTAGNPDGKRVIMDSGMHGDEGTAAMYAWQFFHAFATSTNPIMMALRGRLRITWVPFLNASQYCGSRENSNGVNINRNFDLNWELAPDDVGNSKGPSAMSEPEAVALKALIDSEDIEASIGLHNTNPGYATSVSLGGPPTSVQANRNLQFATLNHARQLYSDTGLSFDNFPEPPVASLRDWGQKYLRWNRSKNNAGVYTLEAEPGISGASGGRAGVAPKITRQGTRAACGTIVLWLVEWLENGQGEPVPAIAPSSMSFNSGRSGSATVAEGGRLFTTDFAPLMMRNGRTYLPVPIRMPGAYLISYDLVVRNSGTSDATVSTAIGFGPMPASGNAPRLSGGAVDDVIVKPGFHDFTISRQARIEVPLLSTLTTNIYMLQLFVKAGTGTEVRIRDAISGFTITASVSPSYVAWREREIYQP